jgi:NADPH-dependent 2,4-dienoyl-CoA reductase/sulfur reductase-like enzyme
MTDRRAFLRIAAAAGLAPLSAIAQPARRKGPANAVVVIGGGFAGATAAKYLRIWSPDTKVTLIEPNASWISCPFSNRVLSNSVSMSSLTRSYDTLGRKYGVELVRDEVVEVDAIKMEVVTAKKRRFKYDRLVVAPGVELVYDAIPGLRSPDAQAKVPHAWKAGPQTVQLQKMIQALRPGGVVAMHIPKAPYRCPPGPYERISQIAYQLQRRNPTAKILAFDANPDIQSKKGLFEAAWKSRYPGIVEYVPNADLKDVDTATLTLKFDVQSDVRADVLNVIPPQRAGAIARKAGLANAGDRWCQVDFLSYESTAIPEIHVIGDSVASAPMMPKSGHMANQHAKVCALAIASKLAGLPVSDAPIIANTCYSFVGDKDVIHVASVHKYDKEKKTMVVVPGSGGLSPEASWQEGITAVAWLHNIMQDTLG